MAAGPTPQEVSRARRERVQKLARDLSQRLGQPFQYERGGTAYCAGVIIEAKLIRASNGEAALWPTARSAKGALNGPPWASDGTAATVDNIVAKLV